MGSVLFFYILNMHVKITDIGCLRSWWCKHPVLQNFLWILFYLCIMDFDREYFLKSLPNFNTVWNVLLSEVPSIFSFYNKQRDGLWMFYRLKCFEISFMGQIWHILVDFPCVLDISKLYFCVVASVVWMRTVPQLESLIFDPQFVWGPLVGAALSEEVRHLWWTLRKKLHTTSNFLFTSCFHLKMWAFTVLFLLLCLPFAAMPPVLVWMTNAPTEWTHGLLLLELFGKNLEVWPY